MSTAGFELQSFSSSACFQVFPGVSRWWSCFKVVWSLQGLQLCGVWQKDSSDVTWVLLSKTTNKVWKWTKCVQISVAPVMEILYLQLILLLFLYLNIKVRISNIFISFSFAAPLVISGNCRCVFGPHFSFIVCSHRPFLCLFGHSNRLLTMLTEPGKNSTPLHTQVSWRASLSLKA